ncbi:MAG: VWA domain-containing protein [Verrucomicrobia bacterium]|nr:VWA domain-containing protein [Verrucomicrobiota bacterium]
MKFANIQMLWLGVVVLLGLVLFSIWAWYHKKKLIRQFVRSRLLGHLTLGVSKKRQKLKAVLLVIAAGCILVALARPQWGVTRRDIVDSGLDIAIAFDTSKSMLAQDSNPNRLERAKMAVLDLVRQRRGDRFALIPFAGDAFVQCPLTLDTSAFIENIDILDTEILPSSGTTLAAAINTAITAFEEDSPNSKVIILFTDGEDHEKGALEAARIAANKGARIFTVGVGTPNGELIIMNNRNGTPEFLKDANGNVVKSKLNRDILERIANIADGFYLSAESPNSMYTLNTRGLDPLLRGLNPLKTGESTMTGNALEVPREQYFWPLSLAALLLIIETFISAKTLPADSVSNITGTRNAGGTAAKTALCIVIVLSVSSIFAGNPLELYKNKQYESALNEYKNILANEPENPVINYNAGIAAYKAKKFDEATRYFANSLASQDKRLQSKAFYNLGNALFRLGEESPNPQQAIEAWQQALENYENAAQLDAGDEDAVFNRDFVKKRLEQLKQQLKEQTQNRRSEEQNSPDKRNENAAADGDNRNQESNPKQNQNETQNKESTGTSTNQTTQSPKFNNQKHDNAPTNDTPQNTEQPESTTKSNAPPQTAIEPNAGQMSADQALKLLDAYKDEGNILTFSRFTNNAPRKPSEKNW